MGEALQGPPKRSGQSCAEILGGGPCRDPPKDPDFCREMILWGGPCREHPKDTWRESGVATFGTLSTQLSPTPLPWGLVLVGGGPGGGAPHTARAEDRQTGQSPGSLFDARATFDAFAWRVPLGLQPQGTLMLVLCVSGWPTNRELFTNQCLWPERPSETATAHKPCVG